MKLNFIYFLIIGLCIFTLQQCKPDDPCDPKQIPLNETYYLTDLDINKIPFNKDGLDTLVYVSNNNDTAVLYRQPLKNYFIKATWNRNANPGCQLWDKWNHETYEYEFKGNNTLLNNLTFIVTTYDWFKGNRFDGFYVNFKFNYSLNTNFYGRFNFISNNLNYNDTISINNKVYKGLLNSDENEQGIKFLYNNELGVLRVWQNNLIWTNQL